VKFYSFVVSLVPFHNSVELEN